MSPVAHMIVTSAGWVAVDAAAFCARWDRRAGSQGLVSDHRRADERCCCGRQNRVVLTPRRWRQVRGVASAQPGLDKTYPLTTVAKEPGHRGEHDISRKTIACGNAGRFRCTRCYSCAFYHYQVHTRPRVQRAPGIPHALYRAEDKCKPRAHRAARSRSRVWNSFAIGKL